MLNEMFKEQQQAEVTIKMGDFILTISGEISPPAVTTDRFEKDIYSLGYRGLPRIPDMKEISFKVKPIGLIKAEQWRWTIPVAIPPRIEE